LQGDDLSEVMVKMSHPNAAQGLLLPMLVALVLCGLVLLILMASWTFRFWVNRGQAKSAVSVFLFGVAALFGALWFGEGAGIVRLNPPVDRESLEMIAVAFFVVGVLVASVPARRSRP